MKFITKETLWVAIGAFISMIIFQISYDKTNGVSLGEIMSIKYIAIKLLGAIVFAIVVTGIFKLFSLITEKIKLQEANQGIKSNDENPNDLVAVAKFHDQVNAHIAKSVLETNGIEAVIFGEPLQGTIAIPVNLIPMSVMVRRSDLETAKKLLSTEMSEI